MLNVEIDQNQANQVQERKGTKNGRDWAMRTQPIYVFKPGSKYPIEITFNIPDGQSPYGPGKYTLDVENAISQGSYNAIFLNTRELFLVPVELSNKTELPKR